MRWLASAEFEDDVEDRFVGDAIVGECVGILELLARVDQPCLVDRNPYKTHRITSKSGNADIFFECGEGR